MAVKRQPKSKEKRRIILARSEKNNGPAKNVRREVKTKKDFKALRLTLGRSLSFAVIGLFWALLFAGLSVALLFTYRYLTTHQYFSLKYLEIQGNSRLSSREILETIDLGDGANLLALSINTVEQRLCRNPWVKEVSVKRILPDRLVLGINEREPVFMRLLQNGMHYADDLGSIIAPVSSEKFVAVPTLDVEKGAEDLLPRLPELMRHIGEAGLLPDGRKLSFVRLSAARGVELYAEGSRLKLNIGLEEWLPNLFRLSQTVNDLRRRKELSAVREIKAHGSNVWVEISGARGL